MRLRASSSSRVLVIGGGVAGATAAIRLAHHGVDVELVERANFPREKVCGCCLGAAGLAALDAIGLGDTVRQLGAELNQFEGYFESARSADRMTSEQACRVRLVSGVALSRAVLDATLLNAARDLGVAVDQPCEARIETDDPAESGSVWIRRRRRGVASWQPPEPFDLVIVATGLAGGFQRPARVSEASAPSLPWRCPPSGPLGVAVHVPAATSWAQHWRIEPRSVQMICGDAGYVGVVRLPDGALDVAAALLPPGPRTRMPPTPAGRAHFAEQVARMIRSTDVLANMPPSGGPAGPSLEQSFLHWLRTEADWMATPPLRRSRCPGRGRIVAIGDALGYVEPLTGEGMTWGIESGLAVADSWAQRVDSLRNCSDPGALVGRAGANPVNFGRVWSRRSARLQRRRRYVCNWVTRGLRNRGVRSGAKLLLRHAGWLARPLTWNLANGIAVPTTRRPLAP